MSRRILALFCCLFALAAAPARGARVAVAVDEAASRAVFDGGAVRVALAVRNASSAPVAAEVALELVDPDDRSRALVERPVSLAPGANEVEALMAPAPPLLHGERGDLVWFRLRYRVTVPGGEPASGVVSLSRLSDLFELYVAAPPLGDGSRRYRAQVLATRPGSRDPVEGVALVGRLAAEAGGEPLEISKSATTDGRGYAALDFELPDGVSPDDAELKVTGRRGVHADTVEAAFYSYERFARLLVSTDKGLYQPGQTVRARCLALDHRRRAVAGASGVMQVEDSRGETVAKLPVTTSRFGVASAEWRLPDTAPLGPYELTFQLEDDHHADSYGIAAFTVSRYDLPNFAVSVAPDRGYYLPGEDAGLKVRADYLFGKPVARGAVRVVRESEREWNRAEQRWDVEEGASYSGELRPDGTLDLRVDLDAEHAELAGETYSRFRDVSYTAYVTDASTGRTEHRRFDLRVSRADIHVYVAGEEPPRPGRPASFYLVTSYADGEPASCEVRISQPFAVSWTDEPVAGAEMREVRTVRTNRYGVAKVTGVDFPESAFLSGRSGLTFSARDARGRSGEHSEVFWSEDGPSVHVETEKTIHRPGEPITARITTSVPDATVFVDLCREGATLESRAVRARGGRAAVTFPYRDEFRGEVTVVASAAFPEAGHYDDTASAARAVLYPHDEELRVSVERLEETYAPGEGVRAALRVRDAGGMPVEGALGVVVFDRAVEERARSDGRFGSPGGLLAGYAEFSGLDRGVGGVTLRQLGRLDPTRPVAPDLDLAAEVLLNAGRDYYTHLRTNASGAADLREVFEKAVEKVAGPAARALHDRFGRTFEYPEDAASLARLLSEEGRSAEALVDPWDRPLRAEFGFERDRAFVRLTSDGPDERSGTADDFVAETIKFPYFQPAGLAFSRAVDAWQGRTGRFVRDERSLAEALAAAGVVVPKDRWGRPYAARFDVEWSYHVVRLVSAGPDGRLETNRWAAGDDFVVWTERTDYFEKARAEIDAALRRSATGRGGLPRTEPELRAALAAEGIDFGALEDAWGRPYHAAFSTDSRYADRVTIHDYSARGGSLRTDVAPVTRTYDTVVVLTAGADGERGTGDDFAVATYMLSRTEQTAGDAEPVPVARDPIVLAGSNGAIRGVVTDPAGAVIPGATVTAVSMLTGVETSAETDGEGGFVIANLSPGLYELRFGASGFLLHTIRRVPVRSSTITDVDVELSVAGTAETVTVDGASGAENGFILDGVEVTRVEDGQLARTGKAAVRVAPQVATPRLREYFPETLVWRPEIVTDSRGRASLEFALADSITTWKLAVIASTEDGRLGAAEREIVAFQPFFVEHDPPKVLTEGDEIALPVVLRNYLDEPLSIDVEMKPEPWLALLGPARRRAEVPAGDSARAVLPFRAVASVDGGKQRVTALGGAASDAVEKPVSVHPDGEERAATAAAILRGPGALEVEVPAGAVGAPRAELKVYPSLMAHVAESVEAIMQRPYGCGEQTVSSAYPSVLVLAHARESGADARLVERARRYAEQGYERLLAYRSHDGGFTYWGRGESEFALTAYALRFLADASRVVAVDPAVVAGARDFLVSRQRDDGSWPSPYRGADGYVDPSVLTTAYVARVLARVARAEADSKAAAAAREALRRALAYTGARAREVDEPYLVACYALAARDAGDLAAAAWAEAKLASLVRPEGDGVFWDVGTNTPFYGWGRAGRVETTALAALALSQSDGPRARELADRALLFLLRSKDRYGVWYSTQATITVLDALLGALSRGAAGEGAGPREVEVYVDGQRVAAVPLPPAGEAAPPVAVDLSSAIARGANRVEIRRPAGEAISAQLVVSYYAPWAEPPAERAARAEARSGGLRFAVGFDRLEAAPGEPVTCEVEAERVGSRGYGMMIAEVGLPPGADVDRASLDRAVAESGWALCRYDVLPDRVVLYLWPYGGGTRVRFAFAPRYGLAALAAPSRLYDYYNPDAEVRLAPPRFAVK